MRISVCVRFGCYWCFGRYCRWCCWHWLSLHFQLGRRLAEFSFSILFFAAFCVCVQTTLLILMNSTHAAHGRLQLSFSMGNYFYYYLSWYEMEMLCLSWTSKQTMVQTLLLCSRCLYPQLASGVVCFDGDETTTTAIEVKQNYRKIPINFFAFDTLTHGARARALYASPHIWWNEESESRPNANK